MSEFTIKISAPEIADAMNNLAKAILNYTQVQSEAQPIVPEHTLGEVMPAATSTPPQPVQPITPVPTQPVQQPIVPTAPVAPVTPVAPVAPTVPVSEPKYTLDELARAGTALVDAGKMNELLALLAKFGVEALTGLAPAQYGAMALELRNLGAQI